MLLERLDAALAAIDAALAITPENAEYHLHRGHLLYRRGDVEAGRCCLRGCRRARS
jgi:regulator of sirC expression with transglutaminase-like and TPR domain